MKHYKIWYETYDGKLKYYWSFESRPTDFKHVVY